MKIAIQGHPTRGKEIIQILESLGGINDGLHKGNNPNCYYELHGNIIWCVCTKGINFKYYTLEEFEKKFPFKIGDRVISVTTNFIGTIIKFKENGFYYIRCDSGNIACAYAQNLKPLKKMKEERNITLTLDKAKEWYEKGGELKEVALQAFTEEELNPLPRSWGEFCKNYPVQKGECWLDNCDAIRCSSDSKNRIFKNWIPSQKSAEAHLAMIQLEQLRDCWRQGWEPIPEQDVYAIKTFRGKLDVFCYYTREFLSFPTKEMAEEFLKCFRDLIEKAGDLI